MSSRGLFIACWLLFVGSAHAQLEGSGASSITTHYDPNGGIVERVYEGTTNTGTRWAYTTSNGQWHSAPSGSPNAAAVTVGRNVPIALADGAAVAGKLPVLVESEVTAAALATAGIKTLRGGIAGILVGVALQAALDAAHIGFDAAVQSVTYNPVPIVQGGCAQYAGATSPYAADPAFTVGPAQLHGPDTCGIPAEGPYSWAHPYWTDVGPASSGGSKVCPNGVQFNSTTQCRQVITDDQGAVYLGPKINQGNGPDIGKNVTGNNGIQFQPDGGVTPSNGPGVDVDPASWPQVSGPSSQTYGPQTTTSTSDHTTTNASGQPITTTTTTTVTNTTNVTNNYSNNTSVTTIDNKTETKACDAAGVCTNDTTHSTPPSQTKPDDKVQVCGLPGKPPCKIDETGTPDVATGAAKLQPGIDALEQSRIDGIANVTGSGDPAAKDTHWQFTFAFPTNCAPLVAWDGLTFDICRFQPMIHDLLSMLWYGSTVFLILGMVGRTMRGSD
jgi:hypothetical protein